MNVLMASLSSVRDMADPEEKMVVGVGMLTSTVLRAFRTNGRMRHWLDSVARQVQQLRDRLTGEMYSVLTRSLRELTEAMRRLPADTDPRVLELASHLTAEILEFSAAVAGLAAENMVRGGGRLFLDFGRRTERAQAIATELADVLDQPNAASQPGRVEAALRLALELRDSVITYRSRYLSVLQPGPVLDLILADDGNPRGLAFQLSALRDLLHELVEEGDSLITAIDPLLQEAHEIVQEVMRSARPDGNDGAPCRCACMRSLTPSTKWRNGYLGATSHCCRSRAAWGSRASRCVAPLSGMA